jgi:hypothetical protein
MTDNGEQQEQPRPVEDIPADEFVYVRSTASMAPEQDPSTMTNFSAPRDVPVENEGPTTGDTAGEEAPVAGADADEGHAEGGADPAAGAPRRGRKRAASGEPAGSGGEAKSQSADTPANTGE